MGPYFPGAFRSPRYLARVPDRSLSGNAALADLELSRPVQFGRASLLPALGLRLFPGRREVLVDENRRLVLPPLCVSLFLGFGYEI